MNRGTIAYVPNCSSRESPVVSCVPEGFAWQDGFLYVRLDGGADPNNAAIEIHRSGGQVIGDPPCETTVAGDVNGDCIIDFRDFTIMAIRCCKDNNL